MISSTESRRLLACAFAGNLHATPVHQGAAKNPKSTRETVPRESGFGMPAEWEPHQATWLGWPHNRTDWPGKFATIPWVYGEIVRKLTPGEVVRIIVNSPAAEARARRLLERTNDDLKRVEFFRFPTDRGWTRDFGPMFVR